MLHWSYLKGIIDIARRECYHVLISRIYPISLAFPHCGWCVQYWRMSLEILSSTFLLKLRTLQLRTCPKCFTEAISRGYLIFPDGNAIMHLAMRYSPVCRPSHAVADEYTHYWTKPLLNRLCCSRTAALLCHRLLKYVFAMPIPSGGNL